MKNLPGGSLKFILLIAISLVLPSIGEVVTLEETGGSSLTARLVSCDGTTLKVIRVSDRKTFNIPLSRLSDGSKAAVKDWQSKGGGLVENFEGKLAFYGGVSTQTVLPYGTPAEVKTAVTAATSILAPNKTGLLVAPSHRMMTDIPMENIAAMLEAFKELG